MQRAFLFVLVVVVWSCGGDRRPDLAPPDASGADGGLVDDGGALVDSGTLVDAGVFVDGGLVDDGGALVDSGTLVDAGVFVDGGLVDDGGVCQPESTAETCARLHLCGTVDAPDNCGVTVRLNCPNECDAGTFAGTDAGPYVSCDSASDCPPPPTFNDGFPCTPNYPVCDVLQHRCMLLLGGCAPCPDLSRWGVRGPAEYPVVPPGIWPIACGSECMNGGYFCYDGRFGGDTGCSDTLTSAGYCGYLTDRPDAGQ